MAPVFFFCFFFCFLSIFLVTFCLNGSIAPYSQGDVFLLHPADRLVCVLNVIERVSLCAFRFSPLRGGVYAGSVCRYGA